MQHGPETLQPLTRFSPDELNLTIAAMDSCYDGGTSQDVHQLPSIVATLAHKSFTTDDFRDLWQHGAPIVIKDVHTDLQGRWAPPDFIREYGSRSVELIDCATGDTCRSSVADFFLRMLTPESSSNVVKLKVSLLVPYAPD